MKPLPFDYTIHAGGGVDHCITSEEAQWIATIRADEHGYAFVTDRSGITVLRIYTTRITRS